MPDKPRSMPNGDTVVFPDTMSDTEIEQQMNKLRAAASQQQAQQPAPGLLNQMTVQPQQTDTDQQDPTELVPQPQAGPPGQGQTGDWRRYTPTGQDITQSPASRFLTRGLGMPQDIMQMPIGQILDPVNLGWNLLKGIAQPITRMGVPEAVQQAQQAQQEFTAMGRPGLGRFVGGAEQAIAQGVPWFGPMTVDALEQMAKGNYAGAAGDAASLGLLYRAKPWRIVTDPGGRMLRTSAGVGEKATTQMLEEETAARQKAIEHVHEANRAAAQGDMNTYYEQRAKAEATVRDITKHNAEVARNQAAGQQLEGQMQQISQQLPQVDIAIKAEMKARYPELKSKVARDLVYQDALEAVKEEQHGTTTPTPAIQKIIDQSRPGVGSIKDVLTPKQLEVAASAKNMLKQHMTPTEVLDQISKMGYTGAKGDSILQYAMTNVEDLGKPRVDPTFSIDELHGLATELADAAQSSSLLEDQRKAIWSLRGKIMGRVGEAAEAEGKKQQFDDAQDYASKYLNTFRNTAASYHEGSPIARALQAREPLERRGNLPPGALGPIQVPGGPLRPEFARDILFTNQKEYNLVDKMLAGYPQAATLRALLRSAKDNFDLSRDPGVVKEIPDEVERALSQPPPSPTAGAKPPTFSPFSRPEARQAVLQKMPPPGPIRFGMFGLPAYVGGTIWRSAISSPLGQRLLTPSPPPFYNFLASPRALGLWYATPPWMRYPTPQATLDQDDTGGQ